MFWYVTDSSYNAFIYVHAWRFYLIVEILVKKSGNSGLLCGQRVAIFNSFSAALSTCPTAEQQKRHCTRT
jgi:hypothetical protein